MAGRWLHGGQDGAESVGWGHPTNCVRGDRNHNLPGEHVPLGHLFSVSWVFMETGSGVCIFRPSFRSVLVLVMYAFTLYKLSFRIIVIIVWILTCFGTGCYDEPLNSYCMHGTFCLLAFFLHFISRITLFSKVLNGMRIWQIKKLTLLGTCKLWVTLLNIHFV